MALDNDIVNSFLLIEKRTKGWRRDASLDFMENYPYEVVFGLIEIDFQKIFFAFMVFGATENNGQSKKQFLIGRKIKAFIVKIGLGFHFS